MLNSCAIESVIWDDWHVVAELDRLVQQRRLVTTLLGVPITLEFDPMAGGDLANAREAPAPARGAFSNAGEAPAPARGAFSNAGEPPAPAGSPVARAVDVPAPAGRVSACAGGEALASVQVKYGFVWVCLGTPTRDIVEFAECRDADRLLGTAGSVAVAVSGLRAVENFLDLSHLSFVHAGYLGEEPFTEVKQYAVESSAQGGVIATGCKVYQPKASPIATEGFDVDYTYAVLRPYIVVLYKANPVEQQRRDMIALFVQPVSEESCVAHAFTCYLKHGVEPKAVRRFQQFIFGQDRPILENQLPKRLPLDTGSEIPVRADMASAAYRRWLAASGVRYGAIAAG